MLQVSELGLFNADLSRGINLFVGAGFSTLAKNAFGHDLPVGEELKNRLVTEFGLENYATLDLPSIYAILSVDRRENLREYLDKIFTVTTYNSSYDAIRLLNVEFLYTTNVDDLPFFIFNARSGDYTRVLHDVTLYGAPRQPS